MERIEKVYNVGDRNKKSILEMESAEFERIWREAAKRMVARGQGTIFFTGGAAG